MMTFSSALSGSDILLRWAKSVEMLTGRVTGPGKLPGSPVGKEASAPRTHLGLLGCFTPLLQEKKGCGAEIEDCSADALSFGDLV